MLVSCDSRSQSAANPCGALSDMPMTRHVLLASLTLLLLALAAPLTTRAEEGDDARAKKPAPGPVEALYMERQYEKALEAADKLVAEKKVDPANEYWAARTLRVLKRFDEAAERFRALAKRFPEAEDAPNAEIDAEISLLGKMPEGEYSDKDRTFAQTIGARLMEIANRHADKPEAQARALYIGGNAFRMALADKEAESAYGTCGALKAAAASGYPAKCTLGLGTILSRNGDDDGARKLYRQCALQDDHASTAKRCSRSLSRMELVGLPAPELEVETWIHGKPSPLASQRGKVVMLFFFATWCPHCKATLPTLPGYEEKFKGQPFQLIAITNNVKGQTTESAKLFVQDPQWKIDYPVAVDAAGQTTIAMEASGIPQVILIDKKGVIRWSDHPAYLKDEMIAKLLAEPGGA